MTVKFYKYQGTGNDFIMIDNRDLSFKRDMKNEIAFLCNRKFGIGADGLILLQNTDGYDFEMVYFNSDGSESTMCGNGGRCLIQFAHDLNTIGNKCTFWAIDGAHEGEILSNGLVSLKMKDVSSIETVSDAYVLNTGSPHFVYFTNEVGKVNLVKEAHKIRYSEQFEKEGINVNFVEKKTDSEIFVRTYERGVEDETLSCGTGVVASCLALAFRSGLNFRGVAVTTLGGNLQVNFQQAGNGFHSIYLIGPAKNVFAGTIVV
jgi:diaminopimelate epimerase